MDKKCYICDNEVWNIRVDIQIGISKVSNINLVTKALEQIKTSNKGWLNLRELSGKSEAEIKNNNKVDLLPYYMKAEMNWGLPKNGTGYLGDICWCCRVNDTFKEIARREVKDNTLSFFKLLGTASLRRWEYYDTRAIEQNKLKIKESVIEEWKNKMDIFNSALKLETAKIAKSKAEKEKLENDIVGILKEKAIKLPVSDINALLKYGDIDEIKKTCEEMYENGKIDFAGNGRYYIQTAQEEKKKTPKKAAPKSKEVDVEKELEKYKGLLDKGLITQEQYDAKSNELLGL